MEISLANILWKQNSPYGTFVAGDGVHIYWDDVALDLVVRKNGSIISTGNNIPVSFKYGTQYHFYYKTEVFYQQKICNSTSLMKFERRTAFPYMAAIELTDSPTCSVSDYVCDLNFNFIPTVVDASSDTALDGSITVSATSTQPIKYRLNSDFEYTDDGVFDDGGGQVSGFFGSLRKGDYLIFARDAKNCSAVIGVTIGVQKTYAVHYKLEYYDVVNNFHHKTEILERDYSDLEYHVSGGDASPTIYNLRGENEQDKFKTLFSGELVFKIQSNTIGQFQNLYTNDPEKFRLRHYVDTGSGYSMVFIGKVLPNQYEESYISPPYDVTIVATDGTPTLKDFPFLDGGGNTLRGIYSQIDLIALILKKIGLGLDIRCATNIYATGMSTSSANDPLDQAYVDVYRYYLKSDIPTCREVLDMILEPYGAQLIQWGGYWNIIRVEERTGSFNYRIFDEDGAYLSNGTYNPIKDLKASGFGNRIVWTDRNQIMRLIPGYGKIRLLYNLGRKDSILENGDFRLNRYAYYSENIVLDYNTLLIGNGIQNIVAPDLYGFEVRIGDGSGILKSYEQLDGSNIAVIFEVSERGSYLLSKTVSFKIGNADKLSFSIRFALAPPISINSIYYVKLRILVTYGTYYLLDDGSWSSFESYITFFVKTEDLNKYQDLKITAASPDDTYISGQPINVKIYFAHIIDYQFDSLVTFKASPTVTLKEGYRTEFLTGGNLVYYELERTTASDDDDDTIRPSDYNSSTNPYQWIKKKTIFARSESWRTKIDYINIIPLLNGNVTPETNALEQSMENGNQDILNKVIYHGSLISTGQTIPLYSFGITPGSSVGNLFDNNFQYELGWQQRTGFIAEAADLIYTGYIRNATGGGYTTWFRSSRAELKPLENIYMDMYSAQYNAPWQSLQGGFTGDILFAPIDTMRETQRGNKIFYPNSLSIDFKQFQYESQFIELTSTADADIDLDDPTLDGAGFTTGFSIGFNS